MKKVTTVLALLLIISLVFSCKKSSNAPPSNSNGNLFRIVDTLSGDTTNYYYNELQQVNALQFISRGYSSYIDTFIYVHNNLKFSQYNLGTVLTTNPYARTEYTYRGFLPVSSNYIFNNNVIAHCEFFFDNAGRLDSIDQTSYNPFAGIIGKTLAFKYDDDSNLTEIYQSYKENDTRQFLVASLSNYDKHPNPVYKFPWTFDVDLYQYNYDKLSKNNCGKRRIYAPTADMVLVQGSSTYTYTYDTEGRVITRATIDSPLHIPVSSFEVYYYGKTK